MMLPSTAWIDLPGGYRWRQQEVWDQTWQQHLLKHPLGIRAVRRVPPLPWNDEGWDRLDPPAISATARAAFASEIGHLELDKQKCGVRELRGGSSQAKNPECEHCVPPLLSRCRDRLAKEPTPVRYAAETERLARALEGGISIDRSRLTTRLLGAHMDPALWQGLLLLSVGREGKLRLMRISDASGARVEFYIDAGDSLRWRTTYRSRLEGGAGARWKWVLEGYARSPELSLSDVYVVPRDWVTRHGT